MLKNKRGQQTILGIPLGEAIGIFLAIGIIIFLVYASVKIIGQFGQQEKKASLNNFEELTFAVRELLDDPSNFVADENGITYHIAKGFAVVGFDWNYDNKNPPEKFDQCGQVKAFKPTSCYDKACICLYGPNIGGFSGKEKDKDKGVLKCNFFNEKIIFSSRYQEAKFADNLGMKRIDIPDFLAGAEYEYFIIFGGGKCGRFKADSWQTKTLYLEKLEQEDKIYIYIAKKTDEVNERYKRMNELYGELKEEKT